MQSAGFSAYSDQFLRKLASIHFSNLVVIHVSMEGRTLFSPHAELHPVKEFHCRIGEHGSRFSKNLGVSLWCEDSLMNGAQLCRIVASGQPAATARQDLIRRETGILVADRLM